MTADQSASSLAQRGARAFRRRARPTIDVVAQRARREAFVRRTQLAAYWAGAELDLDVAPDADFWPGVRVTFQRGSRNRLRIGPGVVFEYRVWIRFADGSIDIAGPAWMRRDVILNVGGGRLEMEPNVALSWGTAVHCSEHVLFEEMAGAAEQVTIADTNHFFTTPDTWFWHNSRSDPVRIGRNTWLCPRVSVTPGSTVGAHCIVAPNSVVVGDVPDASFASGNPATIRPLALPWNTASARVAQD
ncbi:MAG: acyltransferase [Frankiales bacterium]|nr:acyltransferase [Frankiales bacterium]